MRVRLSGEARYYLRQETSYLRSRSRSAAETFVERMADARRNLALFPDMGLGPERLPIPGSRRLIVGDYLLDYDVTGADIVITSIRHGRQMPIAVPPDEDFDYEAGSSTPD